MVNKKNILFVFRPVRSFDSIPVFTLKDYDFLKKHFNVKLFFFKIRNLISLPFKLKKTDLIFLWFADYYTFITAILNNVFKKPMIVVTGGYDVAAVKKMNYGLMNFFIYKKMNKYTLKHSDKVIAVSNFNKKEIKKYLNIEKNVEVIYNSIDTEKFKPNKQKNEDLVISVAACEKWYRVRLKGLDIFAKIAKKNPNLKFKIIGTKGIAEKKLKESSSSNLEIKSWVSNDEIIEYFQKAKVYCQLSYYESCGVAVQEAMACECVPVVSDKGALTEVVADTGYITRYNDLKEISNSIKKALKDNGKGKKARNRAVELFSDSSRQEKLLNIIRSLIK